MPAAGFFSPKIAPANARVINMAFSSSFLLSSLEFSDTQVYEP
jgi:hypothetical protein